MWRGLSLSAKKRLTEEGSTNMTSLPGAFSPHTISTGACSFFFSENGPAMGQTLPGGKSHLFYVFYVCFAGRQNRLDSKLCKRCGLWHVQELNHSSGLAMYCWIFHSWIAASIWHQLGGAGRGLREFQLWRVFLYKQKNKPVLFWCPLLCTIYKLHRGIYR